MLEASPTPLAMGTTNRLPKGMPMNCQHAVVMMHFGMERPPISIRLSMAVAPLPRIACADFAEVDASPRVAPHATTTFDVLALRPTSRQRGA
jgi:hypothetical protein